MQESAIIIENKKRRFLMLDRIQTLATSDPSRLAPKSKVTFSEAVVNSVSTRFSWESIIDVTIEVFIRIGIAAFWIIMGRKLINLLMSRYDKIKVTDRKNRKLHVFSRSVLYFVQYLILFILTFNAVGVKGNTFLALLGTIGVGVGLALKDNLSNISSGIIILLFHIYDIGDFVEVNGQSGTVRGIDMFSTTLHTIDNKTITIPNALITGNQITNFSANKLRQVEIMFGIDYNDDFRKAIKILNEIASDHPYVINSIEKTIRVRELGDSSVNIIYRVWVKTENYWSTYYDSIELAKEAFDKNGISIPFPQMDVHFDKDVKLTKADEIHPKKDVVVTKAEEETQKEESFEIA